MSVYRLWFQLNIRTKISILTPVEETKRATIINGIGQGSFAAAECKKYKMGIL